MNTRVRKEEKAPCSRDSEAANGVHPRTPIAVKKAQGIWKITLKAKIVKREDDEHFNVRRMDFMGGKIDVSTTMDESLDGLGYERYKQSTIISTRHDKNFRS
ncbi:hypothetical protein Tco_0939335 [Tanacetum coccineum]|uniref:Uncharacterized protein n=1 Tax=Tanacetum coccineum TaxID=301880 RepID=A0ABQ5DJS4_9ASTR